MTFRSLESIEELCHSKGVLLEVEGVKILVSMESKSF